uniref:Uncharacterized protein n=1 Tax=Plectus sambesii TaxID=2011161 RepID=A0A914VTW8_9BILA
MRRERPPPDVPSRRFSFGSQARKLIGRRLVGLGNVWRHDDHADRGPQQQRPTESGERRSGPIAIGRGAGRERRPWSIESFAAVVLKARGRSADGRTKESSTSLTGDAAQAVNLDQRTLSLPTVVALRTNCVAQCVARSQVLDPGVLAQRPDQRLHAAQRLVAIEETACVGGRASGLIILRRSEAKRRRRSKAVWGSPLVHAFWPRCAHDYRVTHGRRQSPSDGKTRARDAALAP